MPQMPLVYNRKGTHTLEAIVILTLVTASIVIAGPYVIRSINAYFQKQEQDVHDSFNEQFTYTDPGPGIPDCTCEFREPCEDPPCCGMVGCKGTQSSEAFVCDPIGCQEAQPPLCNDDDRCCIVVEGDCGGGSCASDEVEITTICGTPSASNPSAGATEISTSICEKNLYCAKCTDEIPGAVKCIHDGDPLDETGLAGTTPYRAVTQCTNALCEMRCFVINDELITLHTGKECRHNYPTRSNPDVGACQVEFDLADYVDLNSFVVGETPLDINFSTSGFLTIKGDHVHRFTFGVPQDYCFINDGPIRPIACDLPRDGRKTFSYKLKYKPSGSQHIFELWTDTGVGWGDCGAGYCDGGMVFNARVRVLSSQIGNPRRVILKAELDPTLMNKIKADGRMDWNTVDAYVSNFKKIASNQDGYDIYSRVVPWRYGPYDALLKPNITTFFVRVPAGLGFEDGEGNLIEPLPSGYQAYCTAEGYLTASKYAPISCRILSDQPLKYCEQTLCMDGIITPPEICDGQEPLGQDLIKYRDITYNKPGCDKLTTNRWRDVCVSPFQICANECKDIGYTIPMYGWAEKINIDLDTPYFSARSRNAANTGDCAPGSNCQFTPLRVTCKDNKVVKLAAKNYRSGRFYPGDPENPPVGCERGNMVCVGGAEYTSTCDIKCTGFEENNASYYGFYCVDPPPPQP